MYNSNPDLTNKSKNTSQNCLIDESISSGVENLTDNEEDENHQFTNTVQNMGQTKNKYESEKGTQPINNLTKFKENLDDNFVDNYSSSINSCSLNKINDIKNEGKHPSLSFSGSNNITNNSLKTSKFMHLK